jgi:serine/threonine-protein kinase
MTTTNAEDALRAALADRYRVERELGAGGMATVYLAHDLKHERQVAIKVLHQDLAAALGAERFLAEIKTTAKLQHPHILPLLDSGEAAGLLYYVMPYVAGESLRDRLQREKQLPIDDAVRIAREVADALGHAHGQGIIHRDIKPENILLQEGHALVADFGIALAVQSAGGQRMTQTGLSLGTPQYMSPEQAMGEKAIDARSDIYALGAVTYEMLTGEPPFTGATVQAIVAKVMSAEPERPTLMRRSLPTQIEDAVLWALAKLPADRPSTAEHYSAALSGGASLGATRQRVPTRSDRRRRTAMSAGIAVVAATLGAMLMYFANAEVSAKDGAVRRLSIVLPDSIPLAFVGEAPHRIGRRSLALSPDGSTLAYVGWYGKRTYLFVRRLEDNKVRRLEGTEGAYAPFFSPDGAWVGFLANHVLKKVALAGGAPVVIVQAPETYAATWMEDGRILFAINEGDRPMLVPSSGSDSARAVALPCISTPFALPGNKAFLGSCFPIVAPFIGVLGDSTPRVLTPNGFERRTTVPVMMPSSSPQADPLGFLLAVGDGRLHALRFSMKDQRASGQWLALDEGVREELFGIAAQFAISNEGTLAYVPGENIEHSVLVVEDRAGTVDTLPYPVARYWNPSFAPDGRRIAVSVRGDAAVELQVLDALGREPPVTLYRSSEKFNDPVWTPTGDTIIFTHTNGQADGMRIMRIAAAGGSPAVTLPNHWFFAFSRDGQ